jgi:rubrerythrin
MKLFDFAMQMEKDGEAYYRELAAKCNIAGLKKILNMLAGDEVGHYNVLKKLKEGAPADILESEVLENARNVFVEIKETEKSFNLAGSEIELYQKAIEIEKKSEDFYREKADEVDAQAVKDILLKLAGDEKKHQFLLKNTCDFLARPQTWVENAEFHHLEEY